MQLMDTTKNEAFYKRQVSLSEWLRLSDFKDTEKFNEEDNEKRERLRVLHEIVGLPFDEPTQFLATDIVDKNPAFLDFLKKRGKELCAIRLIPIDPKLEKIRLRGESINDAVKWFFKQEIDPKRYKVDFTPHNSTNLGSSIIVVNKNGIFGEIIKDTHSHLTQGFYEKEKPILFYYDFKNWKLSQDDTGVLKQLKEIIKKLEVKNSKKRKQIKEAFEADFFHNYISGYWETVYSKEFGLWFIDYNRILGKMYQDYVPVIELKKANKTNLKIKGYGASGGKAFGKVKIIRAEEVNDVVSIEEGTIIVCDVTTPDFVPLMKKCLGIITDRGGILSHAGIVARELGLPCIVATENATTILADGMKVLVDADSGVVEIE
jgi:phosphohistidine swiveling domain-containing protein